MEGRGRYAYPLHIRGRDYTRYKVCTIYSQPSWPNQADAFVTIFRWLDNHLQSQVWLWVGVFRTQSWVGVFRTPAVGVREQVNSFDFLI